MSVLPQDGIALIMVVFMLGLQHDPYDTFDYQLKLHQEKKVKSIYFLLLGDCFSQIKRVV